MRVLQQPVTSSTLVSLASAPAATVGTPADDVVTPMIPSEDMMSMAQLLQSLRDAPFAEPTLVQQSLQQIQHCVASHLWHLMITRADLPAYIKMMKDFFLLARGELFQVFIEESRALMLAAPTLRADKGMQW
jgi:hypothetical protein